MLGKRSIVMALFALCLLAPATALGADEEFEGVTNAFRLEGSDGYSLFVLAYSDRADGHGELSIFAGRGKGAAFYFTREATVTESGIEADLGQLGEIDVEYVPTGKKRRVRAPCGGSSATIEPAVYRGTIEFHGEQGYTDVRATEARIENQLLLRDACGFGTSGESFGHGREGARLRVRPPRGRGMALEFQANKNRPAAPTRLAVSTKEQRAGIEIRRSVEVLVGASAFDFDSRLRSASVDPPAPFAGEATFRRAARPANRWTGNLTVDLPGRSNLPLVGPALRAHLIHANWSSASAK